jgi:thiamine-phosphate pyrophosphorylase
LQSKRFAAGLPPLKATARNIICYVTDRKSLPTMDPARDPTGELLETIRTAIKAGIDWVQIREKDLSARELFELAREAAGAAADFRAGSGARTSNEEGPRVIVNDRLDVALAAGADGVHLGRESAPARTMIPWLRAGNAPSKFLLGVSCHSTEELREAENAGADYAFFGPIFATPSKLAFGAPQGIERLAEVCQTVRIPVIAIGGIDEGNAAQCIRVGAAGIAAIRMFQKESDEKTMVAVIEHLRHLS